MAEEKAAEAAAPASSSGSGQKPILFIALAVINMLVVAGVGFMLWKSKKKEAEKPTIEHVIAGEHEAQKQEHESVENIIGKVVPLETFTVNLAGTKGRKILKVSMELELKGEDIVAELDKRKAQIRDIIITILSSKTYDEVSTPAGKEEVRVQLKDNLNSFLNKGKIENVFFTEFVYN